VEAEASDAIVSVFGVIFAPDAEAAAAEMARVLRPGGRVVFSAWLRQGALAEQARMRAALVAGVLGEDPSRGLFAWHDPAALMELFAPHGFSVAIHDQALVFADASPEAYVDAELADHPGWVEARKLLEPLGRWEKCPGRPRSTVRRRQRGSGCLPGRRGSSWHGFSCLQLVLAVHRQ
jgi:SAM-dependent methyltransferase